MRTTLLILLIFFSEISALLAEEDFPPKLIERIRCLTDHGLLRGTLTDVRLGQAHFAPYYKTTKIGSKIPLIRFNKDFVEGKLEKSPNIIRICNPNAILRKSP